MEEDFAPSGAKPAVQHLISSFDQGGSERQALQLVGLLQRTGRYEVHLACLRATGILKEEADTLVRGIPEYPLTSFYNATACRQLSRFARRLHAERIDVLQTHDFYTNVFGMAAGALAGVPVRIAARRETGGVRSSAQIVVERCAYRLAHAVVVNARAVGEQLASEGIPAEKIHTVYNGVDIARVTHNVGASPDSVLQSLRAARHPLRRFVTIVANMRYAVKDHVTFLRAAQIVSAAVPDVGFLLAGEGDLLAPMKAYAAQLGLADCAVFLGRSGHIPELLAMSDVCVLSSRAEGFPNAVVEYMAAGKPVVATDVGGVREALAEGETGYLVAPGDVEQMATKIIALLRDPEQARAMGERGRRVVQRKFSCETQLAAIEVLYGRLLPAVSTKLAHV